MAIVGDGRGGVYCENSLEILDNPNTRQEIYLGSPNPPFGKKLKIDDRREIQSRTQMEKV